MANFGLGYYGSWLTVVDTITTNQQNLNLWTHISNLANNRYGWTRAAGKKLRGIITIASGVSIYSENPLYPAITIPADGSTTFRSYDLIILINNGDIYGAGGVLGPGGGAEDGVEGGKGGTAISARRKFILTNNGKIYGGGGGGGGGGGAFQTGITTSSTNCVGAAYCNYCCILNCQGQNHCSNPNPCTPGAACGSFCEYYSNGQSCNGSTVGTCNSVSRWCNTYKGGNGGRGQGFNKNYSLGIDGVFYTASIFTGDGGNGGNWGEVGGNGANGSTTNGGAGGAAGCWIDGDEFMTLSVSSDEKGLQCSASGSQALPQLWSGWSSTPSLITLPANGSGVTYITDMANFNLQIEPRQALTSLIVDSTSNPNLRDLGGTMNLTKCTALVELKCNNEKITSLTLTDCRSLEQIEFDGNSLTALDISSCKDLKSLILDNNPSLHGNITGLASLYTAANEARTLSLRNNGMSDTEINDIFNQLPIKSLEVTSEWSIYLNNNPGECTADWNIAKAKGWSVYPTRYALSVEYGNTSTSDTLTFNLSTSLFGSETVPYTITGVPASDIDNASLTGNFSLYKGTGQKVFDYAASQVETMTMTINSPDCPVSVSAPIAPSGYPWNIVQPDSTIIGEVYTQPTNKGRLYTDAELAGRTPVCYVSKYLFDVSKRSFSAGFPEVPNLVEWFQIKFVGRIDIPTAGTYQFRACSDDGAKFYINGNLIIDNDGQHSFQCDTGTTTLAATSHEIRMDYYQGPRYYLGLELYWKTPGSTNWVLVPQDRFLPPVGFTGTWPI